MKDLYIYLLGGLSLLLFISCNSASELQESEDSVIQINVQLENIAPSTRAALAEYTTSNLATLGLFVEQQSLAYKYDNRKISKQGDGSWKTADGGVQMMWEIPGNPSADIIAYAPYMSSIPSNGIIDISVDDQTDADFVWTKKSIVYSDLIDGKIPISLYHQYTKITLRFVLGVQAVNRNPKISDLKIIGAKTEGTFDITDGSLSLVSGVDLAVDSLSGMANKDTIRYFEAIILPQTIAKSTNFLYLKLNDAEREVAISTSGDMVFEKGKNYVLTIRVGSNNLEISPNVEVLPWVEKYIATEPLDEVIKVSGVNEDHLWAASIDTLQMFVSDPNNAGVVAKIKYLTVAGKSGDWTFLKSLGKSESGNGVTWGGAMTKLETVKLPDVEEITDQMFFKANGSSGIGFRALKSISAPNALSVGNEAFRGCKYLESVYMPKVKSLGNKAFYYCDGGNLKQLILDGVETMGIDVFANTASLEVVHLNSLKTLPTGTFSSVSALVEVQMNSLEKFPTGAFDKYKNTLKRLFLNGVKGTLGFNLFYGYKVLEVAEFDNVELVGQSAFSDCVALKRISLERVKSLRAYAFIRCKALEHVNVPNVEYLGEQCFGSCTKLRELDLPKLKEFAAFVFNGTNGALQKLKLNETSFIFAAKWANGFAANSCTLYLNASDPAIGTKTWQGLTWKAILAYQ